MNSNLFEIYRKRIFSRITPIHRYIEAAIVAIILPLSLYGNEVAQNAEFDTLVENFNSSGGTVSCANKLFIYLDKKEFTDSKIVFTNNTPSDSLRQQVWYWAAEWYNEQQEYQKAKEYGLKALPLFRYPNMEKADCLNLLGIIHVRLGDFASAAAYAKQCVDIDMKLGDPDRISSSLNTLAGTYMAADQAREAEKFILQGLEYADKANNLTKKAILLGMASEVYHKLGNDNMSLDYARRAFALDSIHDRKPKMAMRLSQMASALAGLKRYNESENQYQRAILLLKEVGNRHSIGIDLNQLGFVYIEQKRPREAISCFRQAAEIFDQMGDLYNNVYSHKGLYESYWSIDPDSAKIALDRFNILKDSLYHQASADALARYNAEFGKDRLQDEIQNARTARSRDLIIAIGLFIVIALIAAVIIRVLYRSHRLQMLKLIKEVEELQKKCEEAEKDREAETSEEATTPDIVGKETNESNEFLAKLFDVVNEVLTNREYGVAKIASMMNMTERTFSRRLKKFTGQSPKMFITAIQMERCAKLLVENPNRTIGEIANLCGFEEASGFSHAFKRVYGCSPTSYREQHK